MTHKSDKLEKLLGMPLEQRLQAVVNDLITRADEFREIDAQDLAESLGISDPWNPGSGWRFTAYGEKQNAEEYAMNCGSVSDTLALLEERPDLASIELRPAEFLSRRKALISAERLETLLGLAARCDEMTR